MIHPGFLQAICEEPDDDAHRLIYADWLDDHGDADRAEFIRLQCAIAKLDDEDEAMQAREADLLRQHGETWRAELPALPKVTWGYGFRRGFVESASLPNYRVWRNQGLALLAAAPVEVVSIAQVTPNTVRRLARSPGIDRVRGLEFPTGNFSNLELEALGKACQLRSFSYFSPSTVATNNLGQDAGRILGTSSGFRGLRRLHLYGTALGGGAARLASAPNLTELEELRLRGCRLTGISVKLLTKQASWPRLRTLDLSENYQIGDSGVRVLSSSPGLSDLRTLDLFGCGVGQAGATALARSMFLGNLRLLDLGSCPIGSDGFHALMSSSNLQTLRILDLSDTLISGEDIVALLRSPLGANLRELNVYGNPIDTESATALAATPGLENLVVLRVSVGEEAELLRQRFADRITIC
jgi:uncharacterized protein (TIGR02996 family)